MEKLEKVVKSYFRYLYPFITNYKIEMDNDQYLMKINVDYKKLQRYIQLQPNLVSATGKLNRQYTDKPVASFLTLVDDRIPTSISQAKALEQSIKRDFYLARRMSGGDFPAKVLNLRIVLEWIYSYLCIHETKVVNLQ